MTGITFSFKLLHIWELNENLYNVKSNKKLILNKSKVWRSSFEKDRGHIQLQKQLKFFNDYGRWCSLNHDLEKSQNKKL